MRGSLFLKIKNLTWKWYCRKGMERCTYFGTSTSAGNGALKLHPSLYRLHPNCVLPLIIIPFPHKGHRSPSLTEKILLLSNLSFSAKFFDTSLRASLLSIVFWISLDCSLHYFECNQISVNIRRMNSAFDY